MLLCRQKASGLLLPQKRLVLLPSQLPPLSLTQQIIILSLFLGGLSPILEMQGAVGTVQITTE